MYKQVRNYKQLMRLKNRRNKENWIKEKIEDIKDSIEIYLDYHEPFSWIPGYKKRKAEWEQQNIWDDYEKMQKQRKLKMKKVMKELREIEKNGNRI